MNRKQSGLTMISWIVVIGLVGIQGVMALRIIPVYINYSTLKTVMDDMQAKASIKGMTGKELNKAFRKRLKTNNLYDLASDKEAFKFKKIQGGYNLKADYEERGAILGNLEFVATFNYQVDVLTK